MGGGEKASVEKQKLNTLHLLSILFISSFAFPSYTTCTQSYNSVPELPLL